MSLGRPVKGLSRLPWRCSDLLLPILSYPGVLGQPHSILSGLDSLEDQVEELTGVEVSDLNLVSATVHELTGW